MHYVKRQNENSGRSEVGGNACFVVKLKKEGEKHGP